jgi:hypothetical protein
MVGQYIPAHYIARSLAMQLLQGGIRSSLTFAPSVTPCFHFRPFPLLLPSRRLLEPPSITRLGLNRTSWKRRTCFPRKKTPGPCPVPFLGGVRAEEITRASALNQNRDRRNSLVKSLWGAFVNALYKSHPLHPHLLVHDSGHCTCL